MQTLCILGRQPALGLAELESLYGADCLRPIGTTAVLVTREPADIDFSRLGGTVKFCKVLATLPTTHWEAVMKFLRGAIPAHLEQLPEGKLKLGLSVVGLDVSVKRLQISGLELKKVIRTAGRSVRVIPNKEKLLSSAQVLHNQLTGSLGWELVFVKDGAQTIVAQNIAEQDIESYAARDQNRPFRDAKVGMLPPKLAQIIINLASGLLPTAPSQTCGSLSTVNQGKTVLDPFCGTGVILQEAHAMGYDAYGTDLEPRMVEYSQRNLEWFQATFRPPGTGWRIEQGDATSTQWPHPKSFVAAETYLGRPFSHTPDPAVLSQNIADCNLIHKKFFINLARHTPAGFRLCVAVPAWSTLYGFKHLPVLDQLTDLGYTRISFAYGNKEDLIYHREGQIVARELVTLIRK